MKSTFKNLTTNFFAIVLISLLAFSSAYSFSGVENAKSAKNNISSKKETYKRKNDVKIVNLPKYDSNTSNEEILMKELMKKISQDYKTTNITIAIDGFKQEQLSTDKQEFIGKGEVKIGEVEWNTINFNVILDEEKNPTKIEYEIQN